MPHSRWISRSTLLVAGVFAAAALTACGTESNPSPTASSSSTTGSATATSKPTSTAAKPNTPEISDASATNLCDMFRPELSNWRVQGPQLGQIALNALVHEWAFRNGAINVAVLADKPVIDRTMIKSCPDVHKQAIEALERQDLASGIVG